MRFGPLTVRCQFCRGRGYVGDDNEPAEDRAGTGSGDPVPLYRQTGIRELPGCPGCFGAGVVVNIGDIKRPSQLVEAPCPRCRGAATTD